MTLKKATDWLTQLGASDVPADELTFGTGSNFGLDGFSFDTPYNEGVEDAARLPETRGLSGLPDGLIVMGEETLDLQEMTESDDGLFLDSDVSGDKQASLVDLSWLDPTQEQDPDRLPDNESTLNVTPQLEEAWGVDRRTDGLSLVPNVDLEDAQYAQSLEQTSALPGAKTAADLRDAVMRAVRRAHFGHPVNSIKSELVDLLGHSAVRTKAAVQCIEDDHGLVGNVFVRAAAFPGIKNGQWVKEIKRGCRTARYVITDDETVATKLGMVMVASVPWNEALEYYRPTLTAAGYKLASGDPKAALKRAFLRGAERERVPEGHKPVVTPVIASREEVTAAMAQPAQAVAVRTAEEVALEAKRKRAMVQVARWVKEGRLKQADAFRLLDSPVKPEVLLRVAAELMTVSAPISHYEGEGTRTSQSSWDGRSQVWASLEKEESLLESALQEKVKLALLRAVKTGMLTTDEARRIAKMGKSAAETQKIIVAAVHAAGEKRKAHLVPTEVKSYSGTAQQAAPVYASDDAPAPSEEQLKILKAARKSGIKASEFHGLVKWASLKMNEGAAGENLDALLRARFGSPLIKAASELLRELRAKHEGLAGHLYVDASAYASTEGTTGCEEGALKHRANGIKYVLAMDRCGSCALKSGGMCQKYNKKLATKPPVADPGAYQRQMLRVANAPEAENLANLFNPSEFNLQNDAVSNINVEQGPSAKRLGEVLFGSGPEL